MSELKREILDAMRHGNAMHSYDIGRAVEEYRAVRYPRWWQFGRRIVSVGSLFIAIHKLMGEGLLVESRCNAEGTAYVRVEEIA